MATHLYETLNLSRSATSDEIRRAYKKLALRTHPDRAPPERKLEAEEEFRRVNAAYEVLIDEEKREIYDRHGVYPPPEPPVEHVYTNPHARQPPHSMPFPTPPSHFERQSRRHHRPPPRSADPFHQTFNEPLFPSTAPPGSGPFGNPFQFTDPFKLFQGVFPGLPPQHILPHSMRFSPMFPIVGGPEFIVHPDHVPPFRPSNANVVWTEERRTTKIVNGREETVWTRIDQDGNVRRTYDVNGRHWETFNDEIVQPYETVYDTHHERIDYPPPPPSSQGRSHKSSTSKKSRYPSPGYSYASATPHPPPPPPSRHIRTTSQHVPNRRPPYRRMHTYSEEDLGAPLSDTENIRPYSYEFAPRDGPRYEEYHYPISSREQHTKRRHERPVPPTPPRERDPDVSHRRTTRPDRPYATVHGEYPDPEPAFIPPSLEHEVKDKRWWQKLKV